MTFETTDSAEILVTHNFERFFWVPETGMLRRFGQPIAASVVCRTKRDVMVHVAAIAPKFKPTRVKTPHWAK